jgi:hypothetical protein
MTRLSVSKWAAKALAVGPIALKDSYLFRNVSGMIVQYDSDGDIPADTSRRSFRLLIS